MLRPLLTLNQTKPTNYEKMKINPIESAFNRAEDLRDQLVKSFSLKQMALIEEASSFIGDGHDMTCNGAYEVGGYDENSLEARRLNEGLKILNLYGLTTDQQECL